jgi:hypothetical protein
VIRRKVWSTEVLDSEGESEEREDSRSFDQGLELMSRAMARALLVLVGGLGLTLWPWSTSSSSLSSLSPWV